MFYNGCLFRKKKAKKTEIKDEYNTYGKDYQSKLAIISVSDRYYFAQDE